MKKTADKVFSRAEKCHAENAHERQWGLVVSQLLCAVDLCQDEQEKIAVLNV